LAGEIAEIGEYVTRIESQAELKNEHGRSPAASAVPNMTFQ